MSINYPLSLPTGVYPSAYTLGYMTNSKTNTSPFTFSTQRLESYGQAWSLSMTFPPLDETKARSMGAFMAQMKGTLGTFYFTPKNGWKGTGNGAPTLVSIDNDLKNSITINPNNTSIPAGSYVQIGTQLVMVLNDVAAVGTNVSGVSIFPRLRSAIAGGTLIIYTNPKGKFSLTSNDQQWSYDRSKHTMFNLEAIESL